MDRCTYSEVEGDLHAGVLHVREETSFLVGDELVGQSCGGGEGEEESLKAEKGEKQPHCCSGLN